MTPTVGSRIEVTCHEVDFLGQGVARYEDLVVFTKGLINEESALVEVISVKKRFVFAKIVKLLTTSDQRVSSLSNLGSLDLAHLSSAAQLLWQTTQTKNAFARALDFHNVAEIIYDEVDLHYRNKVVYHVLDNKTLTLGLYSNDPVKLIRVDDFVLSNKTVNKIVKALNESKIQIDSNLVQMAFRNYQDQILVTLVSRKTRFNGKDEIVALLEKFPQVIGITLNVKYQENRIFSEKSILISGSKYLDFNLDGLKLKLTDQSFLQVNTNVMTKAYQKISDNIYNEKVIDAYSGIGSIGLSLVKKAKEVILIESNQSNCQMAKENIINNKIDNATIYHAKCEDILDNFSADVLIVDPPKAGLHASLLATINQKEYQRVIYLSCDLNTLVRDLKELTKVYQIDQVIPVRMFPQTTSIETLVILKK